MVYFLSSTDKFSHQEPWPFHRRRSSSKYIACSIS